MHTLDLTVLFFYLLFVITAGWCFRRFASNSSQFINGGGAMPWWMAGATAFMTQFSAWTFTGAASKAFHDGFPVLMIFWGNALGFLLAGRFVAARYRRLRVETAMEVMALRYGKRTEQCYTWLQFFTSTLTAAVWLSGLAMIISAMTRLPLLPVLVGCGTLITLLSASGGAWAINASNVLQLVLIVVITLVTGMVALHQAGGVLPIIEHFPGNFWLGQETRWSSLVIGWIGIVLIQQVLSTNNAINCYRFLTVRTPREAQKAAWLAGILFIIGPALWFVPPWVAAGSHVDLLTTYAHLGGQASNAAYLYFVEHWMPAGTLGLILAAMLAATIAPMSAALNRNAGIFLRNLYQRPHHAESHLLQVGRATTLINGSVSTLIACWMVSQAHLAFFDVVMTISSMLMLPMSIPAVWAIVLRRTPDWSGWSTVLVGGQVSLSIALLVTPANLAHWLGVDALTPREFADSKLLITVLSHLTLTNGYFLLTRLAYSHRPRLARRRQLARLYRNLLRPLAAHEIPAPALAQTRLIGKLLLLLAGGIFVLSLAGLQQQGWLIHGAMACAVSMLGITFWHQGREGFKNTRPNKKEQ